MKFKNLIALCALLLVLFASIGITTANENTTVESLELNAETNLIDNTEKIASESEGPSYYDYEDDYNYEDEYDAKIIDTTEYYTEDENEHILDYEDQLITFKVENDYGYIDDTYVSLYDEKGNYYEAWWDEDAEYYWFENKLPVGAHEITVFLDDEYYTAESLTYSVFVEKSYFYGTVTCKSYYGTTSDTLTMKATVKDSYDYREDGTVTFKVNGKSYTVKTKNGVATKTIKIKKAGTYTYTATFKSGNYIDKGVGKAKLYVYSTSKKARTFKIKSYKVVMPLTKYKKFIKAKNANKLITFSLKTNKYFKQKVGHSKYNLKTVKTRVIFLFSYGGKNGGQYGYPNKFSMCLTTKYQNPGWDYCTPWIYGAKKSSSINKLNSAKTTRW